MNRRQRCAPEKRGDFLISLQISNQMNAFFGEKKAHQFGGDLPSTVITHGLPKIAEQNGGTIPDGGSYVFRLDPVINGSQINLVLELDWANKIAAIAFSHELPDPGILDAVFTEELPYQKAPRLTGEGLERASELYQKQLRSKEETER